MEQQKPYVPPSIMDRVIRFFLEKKIITALLLLMIVGWGVMVAPFDWKIAGMPRDPYLLLH